MALEVIHHYQRPVYSFETYIHPFLSKIYLSFNGAFILLVWLIEFKKDLNDTLKDGF